MANRRQPPKSKYTTDRQIPGAFEGETVTRRRLMTLTAHGTGIVAASAFLLPSLGFAVGSAVFERPEPVWEAIGPLADFPDDTYVPRVITPTRGIGEVGKTTVYVRRYNPRIDSKRYQDPIVISTRCMHLGCPVRYVEASLRFICPCHGGVYDFEGKVDGGPPVRPLDRFYVRQRNGQIEVGPRYSVDGELKRFPSYRDPAQDLDGIGQFLYPGRFSTPKVD